MGGEKKKQLWTKRTRSRIIKLNSSNFAVPLNSSSDFFGNGFVEIYFMHHTCQSFKLYNSMFFVY